MGASPFRKRLYQVISFFMAFHGKKYRKAVELVDRTRKYSIEEAVSLLERTNTVKFDPTVEIHFNLAIDPKYADQMVRSTLTLPHGTGKAPKIGVFTEQGNEKELMALGAVIAGGDDLVDRVANGEIGFDVAIATPNMMKKMGKVARVLGPKGLMPNPKAGTVGENLETIVKELMAGKFEFENDKQGNVHSVVGKLSFGQDKVRENIAAFIAKIREVKPAGIKGGQYVNTVFVANAMGPGIQLNID